MTPPHLYQQYHAQYLNYDPKIAYMRNLRLFALGETDLTITDLETKAVVKIAYTDIRNVCLDYSIEDLSERGYKKRYYCSLNETHAIESKGLDNIWLFEYEKDEDYTVFVQSLHQKLIQFPNILRVYHTNYSRADFSIYIRVAFAFFCVLSLAFYFIQQQGWYLCSADYDKMLFVGIVWAVAYHVWSVKPVFYAPSAIPEKYLS